MGGGDGTGTGTGTGRDRRQVPAGFGSLADSAHATSLSSVSGVGFEMLPSRDFLLINFRDGVRMRAKPPIHSARRGQ